jgi:branched-chain amino acid transport system ATP-binding protein
VARTFQTTRLFRSWTLRRVVRLAQRERPDRRTTDVDGLEIVELLGLIDVVDRPCGSLTNADQRLAMIAAALGTGPRVLLLDEPAVGMDASEARGLAHAIVRVRDELGIAVIVVDHNMHFLMPLADDVIVMASGRILARGTPAQVRADEAVIASYLGS